MNETREQKIERLKQQVSRGEYQVDSLAIAEAIVQIIWDPEGGSLPAPVLPHAGRRASRLTGPGGGNSAVTSLAAMAA